MKYRILETNGKFYPQYRRWFRWFYFYRILMYGEDIEYTSSLEDAQKFIDNKINKNIKIIIHEYPEKPEYYND